MGADRRARRRTSVVELLFATLVKRAVRAWATASARPSFTLSTSVPAHIFCQSDGSAHQTAAAPCRDACRARDGWTGRQPRTDGSSHRGACRAASSDASVSSDPGLCRLRGPRGQRTFAQLLNEVCVYQEPWLRRGACMTEAGPAVDVGDSMPSTYDAPPACLCRPGGPRCQQSSGPFFHVYQDRPRSPDRPSTSCMPSRIRVLLRSVQSDAAICTSSSSPIL
jgi:hypothetical protein